MKSALVVGMQKTGTTIVASVLESSIPGAGLYMEPKRVAFFEKCAKSGDPVVVKIIYEHWMQRQSLLRGIIHGETGFRPDKTVAIIRDPRDGLISALMYGAYQCVLDGANKDQVDEWVEIIRDKEAYPEKHSVISLIENMNKIFNIEHTQNSFFDNFMSYSAWIADTLDYLYVLRYEDFIAGNTADLAAYLGIRLKRAQELIPKLQRVSRTRGSGDWRKLMLPQDVSFWKERYGSAFEIHGYDDWEVHPERLDPAVGSDYILRITEEAFQSLKAKPAKPAFAPR